MNDPRLNAMLVRALAGQKQSARFCVGAMELPGTVEPDFETFFRRLPGIYVVTRPELTIVAASDDFLRATLTWREELRGRSLFDVFPDNPGDAEADGAHRLRTALVDVAQHAVPRTIHVLRHDVENRLSGDGGWVEKFWGMAIRPVVAAATGDVHSVLSELADLTRAVRLVLWLDGRGLPGQKVHERAELIRIEALRRGQDAAAVRRSVECEMARTGASERALVAELNVLLSAPRARVFGRAGELVPRTGLYRAYHRKDCSLAPSYSFYDQGMKLPVCEKCGNDVVYRIAQLV